MRTSPLFFALLLVACGSSAQTDDADVPPTENSDAPSTGAPDASATRDSAVDSSGPVTYSAWPSNSAVTYVSHEDGLGANVSGLIYEPPSGTEPAILWAVRNDPSKLYRLVWDGTAYAPVTTDGWITGKALRYANGSGRPDSEGITRTDWATSEAYVAAERDNDAEDVIRLTILRYDLSGSKAVISATHEWDLTGDIAGTELNHGIEAIAWIPDTYLAGRGFVDESRQAAYDPAVYPSHGAGIFLVGVDGTGMIYGYVLDHEAGTFTRVTAFSSGLPHAMDLAFDRDVGTLWTQCGNDCRNDMTLLDVDEDPSSPTLGHFVLRATIPPPKALKNLNNEGFAIAPDSECDGGLKSVFWADDAEKGGYAIRRGTITCGRLY